EAQRVQLLFALQARDDEGPDLVEPDRAGEEETDEEREFDLQVEGRGDSGEVDLGHPSTVVADGADRLLEDVQDGVVEEPAGYRTQGDGDGGDDDAVAQLDEVPDDGHLLLRIVLP